MTEREAVQLAKEVVKSEGWTWLEPIRVIQRHQFWLFGSLYWYITTNVNCRGANAVVKIDDKSATVITKDYLPR